MVSFKESLQHAALTDVGMRRTSNQDSHVVQLADSPETWANRGHMFIVADGMGGHAGGELASKLSVDGIPFLYYKHHDLPPPEALLRAIQETNAEVNRRGSANLDFRDMGTTTSVLVLLPQGALIGHIGDSRIYRLRGEKLEQLTFDHSVDWELKASGAIKEGSELANLVPKNQITRSLGPHPTVQIDLEGPFPMELGDTFIACSDGLVRKVDDDEIAAVLASLSPTEAARALVDLANVRGGPDNVTVLIAKVVGPGLVSSGVVPLSVQRGEKAKPVHPAFWMAVVVCFIAAVVFGFMNMFIPAGIAAAGALTAFAITALQNASGTMKRLGAGQRLGRGPYTEAKVDPKGTFLAKLYRTAAELREAAVEGEWEVDWSKFDKLRKSAEQSQAAGEWRAAVRDATRAISFLLEQLKHQTNKKASDSTIEY